MYQIIQVITSAATDNDDNKSNTEAIENDTDTTDNANVPTTSTDVEIKSVDTEVHDSMRACNKKSTDITPIEKCFMYSTKDIYCPVFIASLCLIKVKL